MIVVLVTVIIASNLNMMLFWLNATVLRLFISFVGDGVHAHWRVSWNILLRSHLCMQVSHLRSKYGKNGLEFGLMTVLKFLTRKLTTTRHQ